MSESGPASLPELRQPTASLEPFGPLVIQGAIEPVSFKIELQILFAVIGGRGRQGMRVRRVCAVFPSSLGHGTEHDCCSTKRIGRPWIHE
jgi:hypothetical protein